MSTFFVVFGYYNQLSLQEERQYDRLQAIVTSIAIGIDGDVHQEMFYDHPKKDEIEGVNDVSTYR